MVMDSERKADKGRIEASLASLNNRFDMKRKSDRSEDPGDLSAFAPKGDDDADSSVSHVLRSSVERDRDTWEVNQKYRQTNAFGLPKNLSPSAALKQEWPPRDFNSANESSASATPLESASDYDSDPSATNVLGLPKNWLEQKDNQPLGDQAQTLRFHNTTSEDVPTNALGIPINWFEQKLAEEEAKRQAEKEEPHITQAEIDEIKQKAHDEGFQAGYKDGNKKGYDEGFKTGSAQGQSQGYKDGYQDGQEKITSEMADDVAFFASSAEKLAKPLSLLDDQIATAVVDLSLRLTRQMIHELVPKSPSYVLNTLNQAIAQLPVFSEGVKIVVNQHDADIINKAYAAEDMKQRGWSVEVNKDFKDGDLQVTARDSTITMTLAGQLDSLIREFIRANFSEGAK